MKAGLSRLFLFLNPGWLILCALALLIARCHRQPDWIFYLAIAGAFVGAMGLLVMYAAARRRVARLAQAVHAIRTAADFTTRVPEGGPRRYSGLAIEINGMLDTLQRVHEKLQHVNTDLETRIQSGVAEIMAGKRALAEDAARRVANEHAITERDRIYRTLHDLSPSGILIQTEEAVILDVNQALCEILGYRRDEMIGRSVELFTHPEERRHIPGNLRRLLEGETLLHEVRSIRKNGDTRYVELHERAISLPDGERRIITIANDITQRRAAEERLRHNELRYRAMFNTMHSGFSLLEVVPDEANQPVDFAVLEINPALTKIVGKPREELLGKRLSEIYPSNKDHWIKRLAQIAQTGEVATFNQPVEFMDKVASISMYSPQPGQVAVIVADITERRRAEEQIRLQSIALESAANGIVIVDLDGTIRWANRAISEMTGYSTSELIGQHTRIFKSGKQSEEFYRTLWNTVKGGRTWRGELVNRRKDGSLSNEEMTITPVRDELGKMLNYVVVKQDISERRSLQQQLLQAQKMEIVGRLAGGVAHDFNNLLQAITGFTHLLLTSLGEDSAERGDALEIEKAARRATDLTRQLLAFSRRQMIRPVPTNLNELIEAFQKMLRRLLGGDIQIELDLAADIEIVNADPGQIEQVLINLAVNARDAMDKGGRLSISTRNIVLMKDDVPFAPEARHGRFVILSVTDTGQGIPPEIKDQIFEPFFTTKGPDRGSGLGLSVVYGIVKQHDGLIHVYSEYGQGTSVIIYLPVADQANETVSGAMEIAATTETPRGHGERILLVEDEPGVRDFTLSALRQFGYQPFPADSCASAEEVFANAREPFDLLFTDVVLPDKTGLHLAAALQEKRPGIRLLFSSGYMDEKSRWSIIRDKGYPFLQKPYALSQLLHAIHSALNQPPPA